jgi:hypothetical protein
VLFGVARHDWTDHGPRTDATGERSQQEAGESEAGKHDVATGKSQQERFGQVTGSVNPVKLTGEQRERLGALLKRQSFPRVEHFPYSISVGASVPRQIELWDLPLEIADALGGYHETNLSWSETRW